MWICGYEPRYLLASVNNPNGPNRYRTSQRSIDESIYNILCTVLGIHLLRDCRSLNEFPQRIGQVLPCFGIESHPSKELSLASAIWMRRIQKIASDFFLGYHRHIGMGNSHGNDFFDGSSTI